MIDLINEYREAVTNILRWRNNPKEVFLNNIVKNMMYRAYSTRLVFDAYLNNELPEYKDFQEYHDDLFKHIRHFAKRQVTWFKKEKNIVWLDTKKDYLSEATKLVEDFLKEDDKENQ